MILEEQRALADECGALLHYDCGGELDTVELYIKELSAYTAAVEAKERERCAAICDELRKQNQTMDLYWVADEIRNLK